MKNLKANSLCIIIVSIFFLGCTTSSFKLLNQKNMAMEFLVSLVRILMECERVETDDRGVVAGFMMHVVDEEKTSFTLVQTNILDSESCERRVKKIEKILKTGNHIYLAGIGDFRESRKTGLRRYSFPRHGTIVSVPLACMKSI